MSRLRSGFCKNGHPLDGRWNSGKRYCKTCDASRRKQYRSLAINKDRIAANAQRWRKANPERHNKNWRDLRKLKLSWLRGYKVAKGCRDCGEKHPACLEFHHRDPAQKAFNIASVAFRLAQPKLETEVAKCDVLCSNCHRKHHWDYLADEVERDTLTAQ